MTDVVEKAREMGWKPQEEYRGDPSKWVEAEVYVERGETFLPFLKRENKKLEGEVSALRNQLTEAQRAIQGSQEAIKSLEEFYSDETKRQVEKARTDLKAQIKSAREADDVDGELDAQEALTRLNAADRVAKEKPAGKEAPPPFTPSHLAWQAENSWFLTDAKAARRAFLIGTELKEEKPSLSGDAFYQELDRLLIAEGVKPTAKRSPSKVEGGGDLGGNASESVKSYNDLPSDAKEVCDRQAKNFVGKDPRFKDVSAWRKYYVETYLKEY